MLNDKIAVVTGGSHGIGNAIVETFAENGATVYVLDVEPITTESDQVHYIATDVSDEEAIAAAVSAIADAHEQIDVIVNNAGIGGPADTLDEMDMAAFDKTVGVNLKATFLLLKHALPHMPEGSAVVNIASAAAEFTGVSGHVYAATKAGLLSLTRTAAVELAPQGIRVNAISPGWIATGIFARALEMGKQVENATIPAVEEVIQTFQPLQKPGQPQDVANAALWLASEQAGFVTGENIKVDGGVTTGTRPDLAAQQVDELMQGIGGFLQSLQG